MMRHMLSMTRCMDGHWVSLPDSATLLSQSTFSESVGEGFVSISFTKL